MSVMFQGRANLATIYASDWWGILGTASAGDRMFNECYNLVGAVIFDEYKADFTMANSTNGYFSVK